MQEKHNLTSNQKAELLKATIYQLYSKEGRSKSYIGKLLQINRQTISRKINEWNFPLAEPRRHPNKSTVKFINTNKSFIIARLKEDVPIGEIAKQLGVSKDQLKIVWKYDDQLRQAKAEYEHRKQNKHLSLVEEQKNQSSRNYKYQQIDGENWKDILGYPGYQVSNKGRVRRLSARYNSYYLLQPHANKRNDGRVYISIEKDGKRKNFILSRLVAHAFVPGYSNVKNTVNHKDGNVSNNCADNLEWLSQSDNNKHAYEKLHRTKVNFRKYKFKKIVYQNKYEFSSIEALARFLHKSPTQTRRYLDEPEKHNLKLIQ